MASHREDGLQSTGISWHPGATRPESYIPHILRADWPTVWRWPGTGTMDLLLRQMDSTLWNQSQERRPCLSASGLGQPCLRSLGRKTLPTIFLSNCWAHDLLSCLSCSQKPWSLRRPRRAAIPQRGPVTLRACFLKEKGQRSVWGRGCYSVRQRSSTMSGPVLLKIP